MDLTTDSTNVPRGPAELTALTPAPSLDPLPAEEPHVTPRLPTGSLSMGVPGTTAVVAKPKLVVLRGEKIDMHYPVYTGKNYVGRTDEKPVDIDLENQEAPDRIWTSRQHAVITFELGILTIEDLNSLNGTFVNRARVHPGQVRTLQVNDVIQIGTVQMRVIYV